MQEWEYCVLDFQNGWFMFCNPETTVRYKVEVNEGEAKLDAAYRQAAALGQDGWELVSQHVALGGTIAWVFKRPIS